jgi:hypothetical protein
MPSPEAAQYRARSIAALRKEARGVNAASAYYRLGRLLTQSAPGEAEAAYRLAIQFGHPQAPYRLGSLLEKSGDVAGAVAVYQQAADGGDAGAALTLGYMLHGADRTGEAIAAYRRCAELGDLGVNGNLGLLLEELNRQDEAVAAWREAADVGYPGAAYFLGRYLKAQGDLKGANLRFATAKEGFRREMELNNKDAYYFYGLTCLEEEDEAGALSALAQAAILGHQYAPRLLQKIQSKPQLAPPS